MTEKTINHLPRHSTPKFHRILKTIAWLSVKIVARVDVQGLANIPASGPFVGVTNHLSSFDTLTLIALAPVMRGTAFGAVEHRSDFIAGWALDRLGLIWVRRGEADRDAIKIALGELKSGTSVGVAIEGTRSRTGGLLPGKTGAVYLATRANVPVLPLVVWGTEQVITNLKHLKRSVIHVRVGPVIHLPEGRAGTAQLEQYTDEIMLKMAQMLPPQYRGVYRERMRDEG